LTQNIKSTSGIFGAFNFFGFVILVLYGNKESFLFDDSSVLLSAFIVEVFASCSPSWLPPFREICPAL